MAIGIGDRIPNTALVKATPDGPQPVDTDSFFAGRTIALFSVPGAFTPTCSARHLPSFVEKADELKAKGIDEIACTAVNDTFVMAAWAKASDVGDKVTMLSDGNGEFADALGLSADMGKYGMGKRGLRWSAVVEDGTIKQLNVEEAGGYNVSGAEYMLGQL